MLRYGAIGAAGVAAGGLLYMKTRPSTVAGCVDVMHPAHTTALLSTADFHEFTSSNVAAGNTGATSIPRDSSLSVKLRIFI